MDKAEDSDKKRYKAGVVPCHHSVPSAVMIQDTLLMISQGYTDAFNNSTLLGFSPRAPPPPHSR